MLIIKPERECDGNTHRRQNFFNLFKQMAVAHSIFTLGGAVQLFWAAFDLPVTEVPLKVALRYKKNVFWVFKKNNHNVTLDTHLRDYHIKSDLVK